MRREGRRQKHQDWTNTAGEAKNLHYMEDAEDEHGNKIFIVHPNTAPPNDEELEKLYRDKGMWLSDFIREPDHDVIVPLRSNRLPTGDTDN